MFHLYYCESLQFGSYIPGNYVDLINFYSLNNNISLLFEGNIIAINRRHPAVFIAKFSWKIHSSQPNWPAAAHRHKQTNQRK